MAFDPAMVYADPRWEEMARDPGRRREAKGKMFDWYLAENPQRKAVYDQQPHATRRAIREEFDRRLLERDAAAWGPEPKSGLERAWESVRGRIESWRKPETEEPAALETPPPEGEKRSLVPDWVSEGTKDLLWSSFSQPVMALMGGLNSRYGQTLALLATAYEHYADQLGISEEKKKSGLRKLAETHQAMGAELQEYGKGAGPIGEMGAKFYTGLGEAGWGVAEIVALKNLGPFAMGAVGAVESAPGGPQASTRAFAEGVAMQGILRAASAMPKGLHAATTGTVFAGMEAAGGGDLQDVAASGAIGAALAMTGRRGPTMKEFLAPYAGQVDSLRLNTFYKVRDTLARQAVKSSNGKLNMNRATRFADQYLAFKVQKMGGFKNVSLRQMRKSMRALEGSKGKIVLDPEFFRPLGAQATGEPTGHGGPDAPPARPGTRPPPVAALPAGRAQDVGGAAPRSAPIPPPLPQDMGGKADDRQTQGRVAPVEPQEGRPGQPQAPGGTVPEPGGGGETGAPGAVLQAQEGQPPLHGEGGTVTAEESQRQQQEAAAQGALEEMAQARNVYDLASEKAGFPIRKGDSVFLATQANGKPYTKPQAVEVLQAVDAEHVMIRRRKGRKLDKIETVEINRLQEPKRAEAYRKRAQAFQQMPQEERAQVRKADREFNQILSEELYFYPPDALQEVAAAEDMGNARQAGRVKAAWMAAARELAFRELGMEEADPADPRARAEALPKLKAWLQGAGRDVIAHDQGLMTIHEIKRNQPRDVMDLDLDLAEGDMIYRDGEWYQVQPPSEEGNLADLVDGERITLSGFDTVDDVQGVIKPGEPGYREALAEYSARIREEKSGQWSPESIKFRHPDLWAGAEEVHQEAGRQQAQLDAIMAAAVEGLEVAEVLGTPKSVKSLVEKVVRKQVAGKEYGLGDIKDHTRGAILLRDWSQVPELVQRLRARAEFAGEETVSAKAHNQFGYRGMMLTTRLPGGLNGEVQVHTPDSWQLKKQTDKSYRRWRTYSDVEMEMLPADVQEGAKADIAAGLKAWTDYWDNVPSPVREEASAAVSGVESITAPNLPANLTQPPTPASQTRTPAPLDMGRRSITLPSESKPKSPISTPHATTIEPAAGKVKPQTQENLSDLEAALDALEVPAVVREVPPEYGTSFRAMLERTAGALQGKAGARREVLATRAMMQKARALLTALDEGRITETEARERWEKAERQIGGVQDRAQARSAARGRGQQIDLFAPPQGELRLVREAAAWHGAAAVKPRRLGLEPAALRARYVAATGNVGQIRKEKNELQAAGYPRAMVRKFVERYYKRERFAPALEGRNNVYLPTPSTSGDNAIPLVLAWALQRDFGGLVVPDTAVDAMHQTKAAKLSGLKKLQNPRQYVVIDRPAIPPDANVVIVEDVVTTGDTVEALEDAWAAAGVQVDQIASLGQSDPRVASRRDLERLSEKLQTAVDLPPGEVYRSVEEAFQGALKHRLNHIERAITNAGEATKREAWALISQRAQAVRQAAEGLLPGQSAAARAEPGAAAPAPAIPGPQDGGQVQPELIDVEARKLAGIPDRQIRAYLEARNVQPEQLDEATREQRQWLQRISRASAVPYRQPELFEEGRPAQPVAPEAAPAPAVQRGPEERGAAAARALRLTPGAEPARVAEATGELSEAYRQAFEHGDTVSAFIHERYQNPGTAWPIRGFIINNPRDLMTLAMELRSPYQETMKAAYLDSKNRVITAKIITVGLLDASLVHPREVFGPAPEGTKSVLLTHNHPSGHPDPSAEDFKISRQLVEAGRILGYQVLDHVITDDWQYYSLREHGGMQFPEHAGTVPPPRGMKKIERRVEAPPAAEQGAPAGLRRGELPTIKHPTHLGPLLKGLRQASPDHGHAILLNTQSRIVAVHRFRITTDATQMGNELARMAIGEGTGAALLLDLPVPTDEAVKLTWRMITAFKTLDIKVVDTLDAGQVSLREQGLVQFAAEAATPYGADVAREVPAVELGARYLNARLPGEALTQEAAERVMQERFGDKFDKAAVTRMVQAARPPATAEGRLEALVERESAETTRRLKQQGRGGYVDVEAPQAAPGEGSRAAQALKTGRVKPVGALGRLRTRLRRTFEAFDQGFVRFMPGLNDHPQLRNDYRTQFMPMRRRVYDEVGKMRYAVMGALEAGEGRRGVNHAVDIIWTRDLLERSRSGQTVMQDLSEEELQAHLEALESAATPEVRRAAQLMRDTLDEVGQSLVARGKLSSLQNEYAPHHVIDYVPAFMLAKGDTSAAIQKKFGEPYRSYTKKAVGSARIIETSEDTLWSHVAKVLLDNRLEDWMLDQARRYDARAAWHEANPGRRLRAGDKVEVNGKKHAAIRWRRNGFTATAIDEDMLAGALKDELRVDEWLQLRGPRGGRPLSQVRAIGADTLFLVPEDVAGALNNLMEYSDPMWDVLYGVGTLTRHWKALTLTAAGLPYQIGNIFGDTINTTMFDPGAFPYMLGAMRVATRLFFPQSAAGRRIRLTGFEENLLRVAQEQDVAYAGPMAEVRTYGAKANLLRRYQAASDWREAINRLAILAHQLHRIDAGKPVQRVAAINIDGLEPEAQAGKLAREALVDYVSSPRLYKRMLSNLAAPFIRFHEQNFRNHFRAATKTPGRYWWKVLGAYALAWVFNNKDPERRKRELQLPDYIRNRLHFIMWDAADPGMTWVWAPQQPIDMAAAWLGLDTVGRHLSNIYAGRSSVREAAREFAGDVLSAPPDQFESISSPLIQFFSGLKTNRDPFTQGRVMPEWIHEEWRRDGINRRAARYIVPYFAEKMITPIAQYTRRNRSQEPEGNAIWDWLKNGPLAARRALGFYKVDLTRAVLAEEYEAAGDEKATYAWHKDRIFRMYERDGLAAESKVQGYLSDLRLDEDIDLRDNLRQWKESPALRLTVARSELRKTDDPAQRARLRSLIAMARYQQAEEVRKRVPKAVR